MFLNFTYEYGDYRYLEFYDEENTEKQVREQYPKLTELDWNFICLVGNVHLSLVDEFYKHINWRALSKNRNLDPEVLAKYPDKFEWDAVWSYHKLDEDFIRRFLEYMDSKAFIQNKNNNFELIHKFENDLNWEEISGEKYIITDNFIREFGYKIVWDIAIKNGNIYENDILREFLPKMNLNLLVFEQLSWQGKEDLLREVKDKIKWDKYVNDGYPIYDGHMEIYDWWWSKDKNRRKKLGDEFEI